MRNVLAIDGGGVRGIVAAIVLDALDAEFKTVGKSCAVADCFDLIAGTSSGAIIAAALSFPVADGNKGATPADLRRFFETQSRTIFPPRPFRNIPVIGRLPQLFGPLHKPGPLEAVLSAQFGDMVFASARRNVMIPAYSIDPRDIVLFRGGPIYADRQEGGAFEDHVADRRLVQGVQVAAGFEVGIGRLRRSSEHRARRYPRREAGIGGFDVRDGHSPRPDSLVDDRLGDPPTVLGRIRIVERPVRAAHHVHE